MSLFYHAEQEGTRQTSCTFIIPRSVRQNVYRRPTCSLTYSYLYMRNSISFLDIFIVSHAEFPCKLAVILCHDF